MKCEHDYSKSTRKKGKDELQNIKGGNKILKSLDKQKMRQARSEKAYILKERPLAAMTGTCSNAPEGMKKIRSSASEGSKEEE